VSDLDQNTVNVVNPSGDLVSLPAHQVNDAVQAGYHIPSPDEEATLQSKAKYGDGVGNEIKAGAAGFARGATFGLSDQAMTKSGLVDPETLKGLQDNNPAISTGSEIAGAVLPAIASDGGSALEGAAGTAAEAAAAPVKAVSAIGSAVADGATPIAEKAAGLLANPETSPVVNKILSSGLAHGAGSAVEGAFYGLGQSISEDALGDPDAMGEHLMSNVGYGALLGGAGGALFGGGEGFMKGLADKAPSVGDLLDKAPAQTLEDAVTDGGFSPEEKESFFDGLKKQKDNAPEIKKAASDLGVDAFIPQLSDSTTVQHTHDILANSPSYFGDMERQKIQGAISQVADKVEGTLSSPDAPKSLAQMGDSLKSTLGERFEAEYQPTKDLYDHLSEYGQAVPVTPKSTSRIGNNIRKIAEDESLIKGTPTYEFVQNVADSIDQIKDISTLKNFRTNLSKQAPMEAKWVAGIVKDKLDALEENAIKRFADTMKTPEAKEKILNLIDVADQAKSGYKKLYSKMSEFGDVLGKSKIYGPQDFMNFLQDGNTSERFAEKLFQKKNSAFTSFFKDNFPKEWETISGYQKNKILESSMKDGKLNINSALKSINKLEPEMQSSLFSQSDLGTLKSAKTYLDAFPSKFNGSNTAHALDYMHALQNPVNAAITTARDYAIKAGFDKLGISPEAMATVHTLSKVERAVQSSTNAINASAKGIFSAGEKLSPLAAGVAVAMKQKDEDGSFNATQEKIQELHDNPQKAMDNLEGATFWIHNAAPKTAGSMQMALSRAHSFLQTKIPTYQNAPLGAKLSPSKAEVSKFNRYLDTVKNPIESMRKIRTGMVTPEVIETLQTVYPKMYSQMQTAVMDKMTDGMNDGSAQKLPYQTKMMLSMFLGTDLVKSLGQQEIAQAQSLMTGQKSPNNQLAGNVKPTQGGMKNLSLASRSMTPMQSIAAGGNSNA
jgi:hypothetical protein